MTLTVELEQEDDGRWVAEVLEVPGALAYGTTPEEAATKAIRVAAAAGLPSGLVQPPA